MPATDHVYFGIMLTNAVLGLGAFRGAAWTGLLLVAPTMVEAQGLEGVTVEHYTSISEADAAMVNASQEGPVLNVGSVVYRVYVDMAPGYKLNMVFGGTTTPPLEFQNRLDLSTTTTFWNAASDVTPLPPVIGSFSSGALFDSYLTIGAAGRAGGGVGCGMDTSVLGVMRSADPNGNTTVCAPFSSFSLDALSTDGHVPGTAPPLRYGLGGVTDLSAMITGGALVSMSNDAWATLPNGAGIDPAGSNRVLIAQLTTDGVLSFHLNVQLQAPDGKLETYVWNHAGPGETVHPALTYPRNDVVVVALRMMLGGPFNPATGLMGDQLRSAGLLPLGDPYPALGYQHTGAGPSASLSTSALGTTGRNAIVDRVLVELRQAGVPGTVVASRSVLVQRDGDVVDVDGSGPVMFAVAPGTYYLAVKHRNHLGCMTSLPVQLGGAGRIIDLTSSDTSTYGQSALAFIGSVGVLRPGDVSFNGELKYTGSSNDRDPILQSVGGLVPTNVVSGYRQADVNMDGLVKYTGSGNDRDPILQQIGGSVPTNTLQQQVP